MLFKPHHIPQIRAGSKTVTRREWAENYAGPTVGSIVAATAELFTSNDEADCWIHILERYRQPLGEMTDADAQAEGDYDTVAEFREAYIDIYGEWDDERVVDVVAFEYVGRSKTEANAVIAHDAHLSSYVDELDLGGGQV